jgi:hypothetical protein
MKQIRQSKFTKIVAYYLMIMMCLQVTQPMQMYALTSGPTQPEFNSFTPIGTSDMVDLASGDFNYNIPIMDVGGYPINLSYSPGITMDQEASWVGLGWNMNVGQIERQVRGLPDDFRGDEMVYENDLKKNRTVGITLGVNGALTGIDALQLGVGLGVEANNYEGISFKPSFGIGFQFNKNVSVGMDFSSSLDEGATVRPRIGLSLSSEDKSGTTNSLSSSISLGFNSRKGVENLNVSASVSQKGQTMKSDEVKMMSIVKDASGGGGIGGSVSFNNLSFTPAKRIGFRNENFSFNGALGGEVFGVEGQVQVTGYGSYQVIADEYRNRIEKGYGYENTEYKSVADSGVLDFNRENERTVTENTLSLPVTNYTYDLYSIDGQGVSGMFRPFRSKVSSVYNDAVVDIGNSESFGAEVGLGNLVHGSGDFKMAPSISYTGGWFENNNVLPFFSEKSSDKKSLLYEPITFKMVGGMIIDPETIYNDKIYGTDPLRIDIAGNKKNTYTAPYYFGASKVYGNSEIKRTKRFLRSQLVQKVTSREGEGDKFIIKNLNAKPHHTAGVKILKTDGSTYVYGNAIYSTKKVEATFDVSSRTDGDNTTGLVGYNGSLYENGNSTSDRFVNRITTPAYAHSYLLSSVLSSDYEDVFDDGPSIDDLGTFTSFEYTPAISYNWRVPFQEKKATYNEGLISKKDDQKGNYLYGEKELKYLKRIVTKSHVAFFDLEDRKDAIGVLGQNGGAGAGRMKQLKSVRLYSRPEVTNDGKQIFDPATIVGNKIKPIKTAHFIYSYNLCTGMPNNEKNNGINNSLKDNELSNNGGKLTLEKVYFTYRGSNMGKYTPYVFNYDADNPEKNPAYDAKGFDIWGNYKANPTNSGNINNNSSNTEFPFVDQNKTPSPIDNRIQADKNTEAWTLKSISLPSGGKITIETESDDYQFVQNKKAMQMFKVAGVGPTNNPTTLSGLDKLYEGDNHYRFLYVKLSDQNIASDYDTYTKFIDNYLKENLNKPIQFKFMLNMTFNQSQYEYVSGYLKIANAAQIKVKYIEGATIAAIPVEMLTRDRDGLVNPIAKAGWGFGRTFMNRLVYGTNDNPADTDFKSIVKNLEGSIEMFKEIFQGPNKHLQDKGCARIFKPLKSWIRLENPDGSKLGGGLRVKSIKLSDNWTKMVEGVQGTNTNDMEYGQSYSYKDEQGKNSSGVATFEPNMCAENPFVEPFYNNQGNYAETVAAPMESNYVEKPFGVNFFPSPRVTYSRVNVKNLERKDNDGNIIVKKHATGSVTTNHYTSYDFPTKVNYTDLKMINGITPDDQIGNMLASIIVGGNLDVRNLLTLSQGYAIETNDMNAKVKSQHVYNEANDEMSSVEYKYNIDENGNLDNNLTTIDEKGNVAKRVFGVDYDLINDFNRSYAQTTTSGFKANVSGFLIPVGIFPIPIFIPTVFPESSTNVNELRTAVTTKHVHKTGMLIEQIVKDLQAVVSTKNLAWDANSGEVILKETVNEYSDHYYSFDYPAYWMYGGMGLASQNIGIEGTLIPNTGITAPNSSSSPTGDPYFKLQGYTQNGGDLTKIFQMGDELYVPDGITQSSEVLNQDLPKEYKVWVVGFKINGNDTSVLLMDRNGRYINTCEDLKPFNFKLTRSGYRNIQNATMASVTSMINPIKINNAATGEGVLNQEAFIYDSSKTFNPRIINASAVVYKDYWNSQLESGLPFYPTFDSAIRDANAVGPRGEPLYPKDVKVNAYVWNIRGDWKAEKSYAYLTGRNASPIKNSRNEGFFTSFAPFYQFDNSGVWKIVETEWTYASSVTKMSPYGAELENKDALERYSAAQYGYQYKLPMAVASNSKYEQIGFEGFEEFRTGLPNKHFGFDTKPEDLSKEQSHTGKASVKVDNGKQIVLRKGLIKSNSRIENAKCPVYIPPYVPPFTVNSGCFTSYNVDIRSCIATVSKGVNLEFDPNLVKDIKYKGYCYKQPAFVSGVQHFLNVRYTGSGFELCGTTTITGTNYFNNCSLPSGNLTQEVLGSIELEINGAKKYIHFVSNGYVFIIVRPERGGEFFSVPYQNCDRTVGY